MTDEPAAAIQASFADFRLIKGRKVCQLVMEIPIEGADAALAALGGIPQPHSDRWVAVARLNGKAEQQSHLTEGAVLVEGEDSYQYKNGDWVPNNLNQKGQYPLTQGRPEPKDKRKWEDLKLSMQAGIRCSEPAFWKFLTEMFRLKLPIENEERAAENVRDFCQVDSRQGLNSDAESANLWRHLDREYQAWLKVAE